MTDQQPKELRLKSGPAISGYISSFSATEKAVFGLLAIACAATALFMAEKANSMFMHEVPAPGGSISEGLVGLPHTINPVLAVTEADSDISALVYSGLTRHDGGKIAPDLASSWTVSPDGLTYDFTMKPGLRFQDGSPLTADDVAFTISKIQDPALKSPLYSAWSDVTATATSPTNIQFTLKQPDASFLSATDVGVLPRHIWGSVTDDQFIFSQYNTQPVGSGPFTVSGIDKDGSGVPTDYRLSSWSGYAGVRPYLSGITFVFFPDMDHALSALQNGSIDGLPGIPPQAASELVSDSGEPYTVVAAPLSRVFGVFFDQNNNAVLADQAVRQALSMSVDREALVKGALYGYGVPLSGPIPPGAGSAASLASTTGADTAGAIALLEKDGWHLGSDGFMHMSKRSSGGKASSTTLAFTLYTADSPDLKQTADMLESSWAKIGASVDIKVFEPGDLYQSIIKDRNYDALLFGEAFGADGDLYPFWHSSQRNSPGLNLAMYASTKADKLLQSLKSEASTTQRDADLQALADQIDSDVPAVFLYAPDFIYAVPKGLNGIDMGPALYSPADRFDSVSSWYMETDQVWDFLAGGH